MILKLTETQAELLYRLLGGKSGSQGDTDAIDLGDNIIPGSGVVEPKLSDPETTDDLLTRITALRQREDQRSLVRLESVIDELESSGFKEDSIAELRRAQVDAVSHNQEKYSSVDNKLKPKSLSDL